MRRGIKDRDAARATATAPNHTADEVRAYGAAREHADRVLREEKTSFLRKEISELGPSMDLLSLIHTLDGRKAPAKPAEPLNSPKTPGCTTPSHPAITDREKANALCQACAAVSRIPLTRLPIAPSNWKHEQRRPHAPAMVGEMAPARLSRNQNSRRP